jgi:antirestriction protein
VVFLKMELQLYIANLGKYNEGILKGEWFTLPVDFQEVAKQIGLNEEYEEYAIHDYEAPFHISEYESLDSLNEIAERLASLDEIEAKAVASVMDNNHLNINEAMDMLENGEILFYHDCKDMSDVAYEVVESGGLLDSMPENLRFYFDYEAFGRDLNIEGTWLYLGDSVYIEVIN